MKIGVLTFHRADNYGAVLQNAALLRVLDMLGHEAYTIDYRTNAIEKHYYPNIPIFPPKKSVLKWLRSLGLNVLYYKKRKLRKKSFEEFRTSSLPMTRAYTKEELLCSPPEFDAYITGSDQIWNKEIMEDENEPIYTLDFVKNKPKISYAASAGSSNNLSLDALHKIMSFDYVFVREIELQRYLNEKINKLVEVVLDPVFLLTKEQWDERLPLDRIEKKPYIMLYYIDSRAHEAIKIAGHRARMAKGNILFPLDFDKKQLNLGVKGRSKFEIGPIDFIRLIRDADFVVASSFHAAIFSIIYEKDFVVIPHERTGSRITGLLETLHLEERIVTSYEEYLAKKEFLDEIDYSAVGRKLEDMRKDSLTKLETALYQVAIGKQAINSYL